jgi:DNA ligase-1
MVLDGELYNHEYKDKFEKLASIIRKQTPDETQLALAADVIQYHIYDIASHEGNFHARNTDMRDVVFERFLAVEGDKFQRVETVYVDTMEYLDSLYGDWMAEGYEGQMIRMNEAYQTQRRSNFLIKRKEFDTAEFRVTGMQEGEGNWSGACKQFEIELEDGTPGVATPRGSYGDMQKLFESATHPDWCTVRFFGRTAYGALRFPVAIDYGYGERRD